VVSSQEADLLLFKLLAARRPSGMYLQYKPQLLASRFVAEVDQQASGQSQTPARRMEEDRLLSRQAGVVRGEERFMDFLKKKTMEEFSLAAHNPFAPKPPKEDLQKQLPGSRAAAPAENKPFYAPVAAVESKPAEARQEGFMTARYLLERNLRNKGHFTQQCEPTRQSSTGGKEEAG